MVVLVKYDVIVTTSKTIEELVEELADGFDKGSLSTVVGDEKLTSREDRIGPLFMYVQCDEDTFLKVDKVSKTEAQTFDVFDQLISRFKFRV